MEKSDRQVRCEPEKYILDKDKTGVLKVGDGVLGKYAYVSGGTLCFRFVGGEESGGYVDDLLAVLRNILLSYDKIDDDTQKAIDYIQLSINTLDERAEKKHGYSYSKEEQEYIPEYKKKRLEN